MRTNHDPVLGLALLAENEKYLPNIYGGVNGQPATTNLQSLTEVPARTARFQPTAISSILSKIRNRARYPPDGLRVDSRALSTETGPAGVLRIISPGRQANLANQSGAPEHSTNIGFGGTECRTMKNAL